MIRICYILWDNAPQGESTCLGYQVLWNSWNFRGGELLVRKRLVQVSDKYPGICPFHCKPCHHPIQEQSQGDCRSLFWSSWAINKIPQKTSEISGENLKSQLLICHRIQMSMSSVKRYLGRLGYKGRVVRCKPLLQPANIARRCRWAKEMIKKPLDFWQVMIFSDKSSFTQFSYSGYVWVWRSPDQEF